MKTLQNTWLFRPSHNPLRSDGYDAGWALVDSAKRGGAKLWRRDQSGRSKCTGSLESVLCYNLTDKQSFLLLHWVKYLRNLMSVQNRSDLRHIMSQGSA